MRQTNTEPISKKGINFKWLLDNQEDLTIKDLIKLESEVLRE